jgi:hypothetical protein
MLRSVIVNRLPPPQALREHFGQVRKVNRSRLHVITVFYITIPYPLKAAVWQPKARE